MKTPELQLVTDSSKEVKSSKLRKVVAGVALGAGLVTVAGVTVAKDGDNQNKDALRQVSAEAEARTEFVNSIANPQVHDKLKIYQVSVDLRKGTHVNDSMGVQADITQDIQGILNPALSPNGKELCFTSGQGRATCVDIALNANYLVVHQEGTDHVSRQVELSEVTPVEVEVTDIDTMGKYSVAYSETMHQYLAAQPGDVMIAPSPDQLPTN